MPECLLHLPHAWGFHQWACGQYSCTGPMLRRARAPGLTPSLKLCFTVLRFLVIFIFELCFCKWHLMRQWSMCMSRGNALMTYIHEYSSLLHSCIAFLMPHEHRIPMALWRMKGQQHRNWVQGKCVTCFPFQPELALNAKWRQQPEENFIMSSLTCVTSLY